MRLKDLQSNWERFGESDPLWSICTQGPKNNNWDERKFFESGATDVGIVAELCESIGLEFGKGKVLDFGCGVGRLTRALCAYFDEIHGVDIAHSMIRQARDRNQFPDRCHYTASEDVELSLFEADTFDLILTLSVFQHIEPRYVKEYLSSFSRILKPGGLLVFQEHARPKTLSHYVKNVLSSVRPRWLSIGEGRARETSRSEPIMETYGIPRHRLLRILESQSFQILDSREAPNFSGAWKTFIYVALKPQSP